MANCPLCEDAPLSSPEELQMQACVHCAGTLGLIAMPPAQRPPKPCTQCNGMKFLRALPREHSTTGAGKVNGQVSVPMMLTHPPAVHKGWVLQHTKQLELHRGYGLLEVYVCTGCGFVEWYCRNPMSIPVHPHLMTELIDYSGDGPYR